MMKKPHPHPQTTEFLQNKREIKDELAAPTPQSNQSHQSPIPSYPTPFTACSVEESQVLLYVAQSSFFMGAERKMEENVQERLS